MKIVQITDIHVGLPEEHPFGVNLRANFLTILEKAKKEQPDFLVLSGDLCYQDGKVEIYEWVKKYLEKLPFPYYIIGGNHDNVPMMANVFDLEKQLEGNELFYTKKIDNQLIIFLDSAKARMNKEQYDWLGNQLKKNQKELIIFIHHPPAVCGIPYMDENHGFQEIEKLQTLLFQYQAPIHIFTGHFHVQRTIRIRNLVIQITPSTFFQLNPNYNEFKVAHHKIGYRVIETMKEGIQTAVKYVFD